jgi:hypothetical protein
MFLAATVGCCVLLAGCQGDSVVYHEAVPVTRAAGDSQEPRFRMITAIAERPQATWFFKLSGPLGNVEGVLDGWSTFLQSVRFEEREPAWTLPPGWNSNGFVDRPMPGGSSMRIANIATSDADAAISVSSMPAGQQLLPNVNRWRGQLGLGPVNEWQLATQLSDVAGQQVSFKVFDARGPQLTTRMGGAPFAAGAGAARRDPHDNLPGMPAASTSGAEVAPIEYDEPADWEAGETSATVLGRWSRQTGQGSVEMLLLRISASDESWKMSVEMWARQLDLQMPPVVAEITQPIQVAGRQARQVQLQGAAADAAENRALVAVMFDSPDGDGYVLKLAGDVAAVQAATADFRSLLESVRFRKSAG